MIRPRRARPGQSLPELLIALALVAVIGTALTRLMLSQSRFVDRESAMRSARMASRGVVSQLMTELQMVEASGSAGDTTGVVSAADSLLEVRAPYAFGMVCGESGTGVVAMLLPADSIAYDQVGPRGYAWRDTLAGRYHYRTVDSLVVPTAGAVRGLCATAGIDTLLPGKRIVLIHQRPPTGSPYGPGSLLFLFRSIRYEFAPSISIAGARGLFRTVDGSGVTEEIAAPFDASARFRFFRVGSDTAQPSPPVPLNDLRGVELVLTGLSERTPQGATGREKSRTSTAVFFRNTRD